MFESAAAGLPLPPALASAYGGVLSLPGDCLVTNFVESVDGVVAFPDAGGESGGIVSGHSEADRFLMGLLRACADAVLIGAGTLRAAAPSDLWTPEYIFPHPGFAELRKKAGLAAQPQLYVVSGSGQVDPSHAALQQGGIVMTGTLSPAGIIDAVRGKRCTLRAEPSACAGGA